MANQYQVNWSFAAGTKELKRGDIVGPEAEAWKNFKALIEIGCISVLHQEQLVSEGCDVPEDSAVIEFVQDAKTLAEIGLKFGLSRYLAKQLMDRLVAEGSAKSKPGPFTSSPMMYKAVNR